MKRILSLLLVCLMALSGLTVTSANAEGKQATARIEVQFIDIDGTNTFENQYVDYDQDGSYLLGKDAIDCPEGYYFYPAEQTASIIVANGQPSISSVTFILKQVGVAGGDGSAKTPYVILDKNDLNAIRDDVNANYCLGCDIPFGYSGAFEPIPEFNGSLEGNGFTISDIFETSNDMENDGGYGFIYINNGVIRNVNFDDCGWQAAYLVGTVASINKGTIENVQVVSGSLYAWVKTTIMIGDIEEEGGFLGGITGINYGKLYRCSTTYTFFMGTRGQYQGCIAGCNFGSIEQCYAAYSPMNRDQVFHEDMIIIGGLVGGNLPGGVISNSFAGEFVKMYAINGVTGVGGLIGANAGSVICSGSWNQDILVYTLDNCHNCIGFSQNPERIECVYYQNQNEVTDDDHGTSRTREELMSGDILPGWSTDIWIFQKDFYPRLWWTDPDYIPLDYTVRFIDPTTNAVIKTEMLAYGMSANAPENTYKKGYHFCGWDKDFSFVTESIDVYAVYCLIGDVNRDGIINTGDATLTLRMTLDMVPMDEHDVVIADVNYSGEVNTGDVTLQLQLAVGTITGF